MVSVYVQVDPSDVLEELSDADLIAELEERQGTKFRKLVSDPDEDAKYLRRCIEHHDWSGAMVYLDRLFPSYKCDPAKIAEKYVAWKKEHSA